MSEAFIGPFTLVVIVIFLVLMSAFVVRQWERAAIIRFGQIVEVVETGLHFKIPFIDTIQRVDMRMQTIDLHGQLAITKDNISVGIDAVVFMRIEDAERVIEKDRIYQYL